VLPRGVAALVSAAGLCAAGLVLSTSGIRLTRILLVAAILLGGLLLWGTASALWSVNPVRSLVVAARLAGLFAVGLALAAGAGMVAAPRRLTFLLLIGMALGIAMVAIELATAGGLSSLVSDRAYRPTQLNQASISFALLVFPASALLISLGQAIFATLLATATAVTVYVLAGTSAKALLLAGLVMGLLLHRARPVVAGATVAISVLVIIAAPLTFARLERVPGLGETADSFKISAGHRLLIWSFAGDTNRPAVNQMQLQPEINYSFKHDPNGYLTFSPTITANWQAGGNQRWTVPLSLGIGQLVKWGSQPINLQATAYYNVVAPADTAPWTLEMELQFLFPK